MFKDFYKRGFYIILLIVALWVNFSMAQEEITEKELKDHILFLTSDKNSGRYPGEKSTKRLSGI